MKSIFPRLVLILAFVCGSSVADTDIQDTQWFAGGAAGGQSHLTRLDDMILVTVEVAGLVPGDAVTLWWVVFNNPAGCAADPFVCDILISDVDSEAAAGTLQVIQSQPKVGDRVSTTW